MIMRPRDLCSAAFADDVQRLRQLIRAAFPPPDDDEEDEEEAEGAGEGAAGRRAPGAEGGGGGDEDDEEAAEPDEEVFFLRRSDRQRRRGDAIAAFLCRNGLLVTPETGETCGFLFRVAEVPGGGLQTTFKASRRSVFEAAPLHWAVLGRARRAVEFLVASGVDVAQTVPDFPGVTAAVICARNALHETGQCLEKAREERELTLKCDAAKRQAWNDALEAKRIARERQAALDAQAAKEAEEREKAEEEEEQPDEEEEHVEDDEDEEL